MRLLRGRGGDGVGGAAETAVAGGGVGGVVGPRGDAVAVAVRRVAQVRAAADDAFTRSPGVGAPLPHVPRRVEQPEGVRPVRGDGHRAGPSARPGRAVAVREVAPPDVALLLTARVELVAPRVPQALGAAARRVLPLRLRGEAGAGPRAVGEGVGVGDVDDGMVGAVVDPRAGTLGGAPCRALDGEPPRRPGDAAEHMAVAAGGEQEVEDVRTAVPLGVRHISGGPGERGEGGVRHGGRVDAERVHPHRAHRPLAVGVVALAERVTHEERAAGQRHLVPARRHRATRRGRREREQLRVVPAVSVSVAGWTAAGAHGATASDSAPRAAAGDVRRAASTAGSGTGAAASSSRV